MPQIPQDLIQALRAGRVVPFVGAGLSISVDRQRFLSWEGLIQKLEERLRLGTDDDKAVAQQALALRTANPPDLIAAAELLAQGLNPDGLGRAIQDLCGGSLRGSLDCTGVAALWRLRPKLVITTNYDDTLRLPFATGEQPVLVHNSDGALFPRLGEAERPMIWHLHGSAWKPEDVVLTRGQYQALYGAERKARLEKAYRTLAALLADRVLLYLGSGVEAAIVEGILREMNLTGGYNRTGYVVAIQGEQSLERLAPLNLKRLEFSGYGAPFFDLLHQIGVEAFGEPPVLIDGAAPRHTQQREPLVEELLALTSGVYLDPNRTAEIYRAASRRRAALTQKRDGLLLPREVIHLLGDENTPPGEPPPLPSFLETLLPDVPAALQPPLQDWLARATPAFGAAPAAAVAAPPRPPAPYVLVSLPDSQGRPGVWRARAWLFGDGQPEGLLDGERLCTRSELEVLLYDLVDALEERAIDPSTVDLAFLLPRSLLAEPIDQMRPAAEGSFQEPPIGGTCRVTVRPHRSRPNRARRHWQNAWRRWRDGSAEVLVLQRLEEDGGGVRRAVWLDAASLADPLHLNRLRADDLAMVALQAPPSSRSEGLELDPLELALQVGLPVALWARAPLADDPAAVVQAIEELLANTSAGELAAELLRRRQQAIGCEGHPGGCLSLLADDADRVAPTLDPNNRLSLTVETQ